MKDTNNSTMATIGALILQSPMFLLVSMILSFVIMFGIQLFYYSDMIFQTKIPQPFNYIAGASIGLMTQLARLAFGIAGASDFAKGSTAKGLTGMLFSLGLAIVGAYEVAEMAHMWASDADQFDQGFYSSCLLVLELIVWLGFLLEIRIAISVGGELALKEDTKEDFELEDIFSSNGKGKTSRRSKVS